MGADQTGRSRVAFARYKGEAEKALPAAGFPRLYIWGQPAAGQYLQFFPDGTFLDHGVTDQLIVPSPFYSHPRIQRGTYSIQSQTMIFTFTDGHRGTRTFIAPKAEENETMFDWFGLGWQQLYEQNYAMRLRQGQQ